MSSHPSCSSRALNLPGIVLMLIEDWLRGGRRGVDTTARAKDPRVTRGMRLA
jgi:hypothetical protein